ncbi:DUF5677 domain-containing protein [Gemmatimonas aurantiaca]|uniref:DUF5677 domain-containing protein n=1 Tax=Gemmatimonas aurantiaca TaxID=173480 RepID=UPI00301D6967
MAKDDVEFDHGADEITRRFTAAIPEIVQEGAKAIADRMEKRTGKLLRQLRRDRSGFRRRLHDRWADGLDRLEVLVHTAVEFGHEMHERIRKDEVLGKNPIVCALHRLHARACRVCGEILALLESGYPDGAHARWRTLHEIAVVAMFLRQSESDVAERYLLHDAVGASRAAHQFEEHVAALGWDPVPPNELAELRSRHDELIARFGKSFGGDYGWACAALDKERVTLADIEAHLDLKRWRPFYRWASEAVHAGPGGLRALGVTAAQDDILLAGSVNHGLADPGQNAALSLEMATVAFAQVLPSVDHRLYAETFIVLARRCQSAFMDCHRSMENARESDEQQ